MLNNSLGELVNPCFFLGFWYCSIHTRCSILYTYH